MLSLSLSDSENNTSFLLCGSAWSEDGCFVDRTNRTHTICMCNHLTNFAILMDVVDEATAGSMLGALFTDNVVLRLVYGSAIGCALLVVGALLVLRFFHGTFVKVRAGGGGGGGGVSGSGGGESGEESASQQQQQQQSSTTLQQQQYHHQHHLHHQQQQQALQMLPLHYHAINETRPAENPEFRSNEPNKSPLEPIIRLSSNHDDGDDDGGNDDDGGGAANSQMHHHHHHMHHHVHLPMMMPPTIFGSGLVAGQQQSRGEIMDSNNPALKLRDFFV